MKVRFRITLAAALAAALLAGGAPRASAATVSRTFPYTRGLGGFGLRVGNSYVFCLSLHTAATGGDMVWREQTRRRRLANLRFSWSLGSRRSFQRGVGGPVDFSRQLWVQLSRVSGGACRPLGGRTKLRAVPYALWSAGTSGDHGALSGLLADDHPQYLALAQDETLTGRPAFSGGDASNPPFSVNSNVVVSSLNADLLDGMHAADIVGGGHAFPHADLANLDADDHPQYLALAQDEAVTGRPAFNGGDAANPPFSVDSSVAVANLNADLLDARHAADFAAAGHDHPQFFKLDDSAREVVTGRPAFNGGDASTPPFTVGSSVAVANLNADLLDGRHGTDFVTRYARVARVALSGGDYTSPYAALAAVGTAGSWCPSATASAPCLIRIMPGEYNLFNFPLVMKPWVDIEGSGEKTTVIKGAVSSNRFPPDTGLVWGASNAELRFLSLVNTAVGTSCVALYNTAASPSVQHVTLSASGPDFAGGVFNAYASAPALNFVTVRASGASVGGIYSACSSCATPPVPLFSHLDISVTGTGTSVDGIHNSVSAPVMRDITVTASGGWQAHGVFNETTLANSTLAPQMERLTLLVSTTGGDAYGVRNQYVVSAAPPAMHDIAIKSSASLSSYGVYNDACNPPMDQVRISASTTGSGAGTASYGVFNHSSSPAMSAVSAAASGGAVACGVYNRYISSPTLREVSAGASGGGQNYGMVNEDYVACATPPCSTVRVDRSSLRGATRSILNDAAFDLSVGASGLGGGAVNALGAWHCVGAYDTDTYTALNGSCQ